jgi:hypothetical protein
MQTVHNHLVANHHGTDDSAEVTSEVIELI